MTPGRPAVAVLLLSVASAFAGCGDGPERVTGVVTAVDGDLTAVRSFEVRTADGERLTFVPEPGTTFDGGPLSHVADHLRSGEPVTVLYEMDDAGDLVAVAVEDG